MQRFPFAVLIFAFTTLTAMVPGSTVAASESDGADPAGFQRSLKNANAVFKVFDDDSSDAAYFKQKEIVALYARSTQNLPSIKATITDARIAEEDQVLAILLAQCLPLPDYLELVKFGQQNLEAGRLRETVLRRLVAPGPEWGTLLAREYKRQDVRDVLGNVSKSRAATDRLRDAVKDVLDGTNASYIDAYKDDTRFPQLSCDVKKTP